jgi:carotenoid cleavage dioxygenase
MQPVFRHFKQAESTPHSSSEESSLCSELLLVNSSRYQRNLLQMMMMVKLSDKVFLACFIFNNLTTSSEWHVYDGETMSSEPVARYAIPARVPYGFHGEWISEEQLQLHIKNIAN